MAWEAVLWVAVAVAAPAAAVWAWPRLAHRVGRWSDMVERATPWIHGLIPAYLALITGAVLGRDFGLYGQGWAGWLCGLAACVLPLGAAWLARRFGLAAGWAVPAPVQAAQDEPRWSLYRAAGALWTGLTLPGVMIGLVLGAAEWALARRLWRRGAWRQVELWVPLVRLALSSALFAVTHNVWLTAATHAGVLALLRQAPPLAPAPSSAESRPLSERVLPNEEAA